MGMACGTSGWFVIYRGFMNKFVVLYNFCVKMTISKPNTRLGVLLPFKSLFFLPLSFFCFSELRSCSITLCHRIHIVDQTNLGLGLSGLGFLSADLQTCATIPVPFLTFKILSALRSRLSGYHRKRAYFMFQCWMTCCGQLNNSYPIKPGF